MNAITRFKAPFCTCTHICVCMQFKARDEGWFLIINFTVILRLFFIIYWEASSLKKNERVKLYVVIVVKRILVSTLRAPSFCDLARGGTWSKKWLPSYSLRAELIGLGLLILLRDTHWWVNKRGILVLFWSAFVFQKIRKNRTRCRPLQKWRTLVPQVWTCLLYTSPSPRDA